MGMATGLATGSGGGTQLIGGKQYVIGSPEWQAAMSQDQIHQADIQGQAAGTKEASAITSSQPALLGLMQAVTGLAGNGSSGSGSGAPGSGVSSNPIQIQAPDFSAANAAEFAAAKDQVGKSTSGALTGLRSALAGRGLLGSGAESRGTTAVITKGQEELGNTSRQQAITGAENEQKNAEANLGAAVTQRGQDIAREASIMENQRAQAEMQYQQRQTVLTGLMAALTGAVKSY